MDFQPFPKLSRLAKWSQHCTITEKVDGTNAQIVITEADETDYTAPEVTAVVRDEEQGRSFALRAGSRNRWITPGKETDNYGFASWVQSNAEELMKLGVGRHFGEWYGNGIQRGYGLDEKRFALFNVDRFREGRDTPPACCEIVPVLYEGHYEEHHAEYAMSDLAEFGSQMVSGFMKPEGIIVHLRGPRVMLKKTFEFDGGKWQAAA
ncbi:MAG: RNA ligase family protein [Pararhizobium sp.]